jgi:hypothetical protein
MNTANMGVVRVNITLPKVLLSELEKKVPVRGKSSFVADAIEEKLAREKREAALQELAVLPPTFLGVKDAAVYIENERAKEDKERASHLNA